MSVMSNGAGLFRPHEQIHVWNHESLRNKNNTAKTPRKFTPLILDRVASGTPGQVDEEYSRMKLDDIAKAPPIFQVLLFDRMWPKHL